MYTHDLPFYTVVIRRTMRVEGSSASPYWISIPISAIEFLHYIHKNGEITSQSVRLERWHRACVSEWHKFEPLHLFDTIYLWTNCLFCTLSDRSFIPYNNLPHRQLAHADLPDRHLYLKYKKGISWFENIVSSEYYKSFVLL